MIFLGFGNNILYAESRITVLRLQFKLPNYLQILSKLIGENNKIEFYQIKLKFTKLFLPFKMSRVMFERQICRLLFGLGVRPAVSSVGYTHIQSAMGKSAFLTVFMTTKYVHQICMVYCNELACS